METTNFEELNKKRKALRITLYVVLSLILITGIIFLVFFKDSLGFRRTLTEKQIEKAFELMKEPAPENPMTQEEIEKAFELMKEPAPENPMTQEEIEQAFELMKE